MAGSVDSITGLKSFGLDLIKTAGKEALSFYGKGKHDAKFDQALVTRAELHLNSFFTQKISLAYPDHLIYRNNHVSEAYTHDNTRYLWIFDPIDGVDNFQTGIPIWGMSLALIENFWPVFGAFYMPSTEDMFHAVADGDAFWGNRKINMLSNSSVDDESLLLTFSRFHQQYRCRFPGKIRDLGCTGAHICYMAMGRADAAITAHESYQGLAATRVILEAAGGKFYKSDGTEFYLNEYLSGERINNHLLAVAPENMTFVLSCLERNRQVRSV
ncbi:MAG: inositol monophosphatase [Desulfobacteraceae bacterium]|nr:inositol monophosphatase [Desulfobacteraceae bacterium]